MLSIPFFTLLFGLSLQSEAGFNQALSVLNSIWLQPIFALLESKHLGQKHPCQ